MKIKTYNFTVFESILIIEKSPTSEYIHNNKCKQHRPNKRFPLDSYRKENIIKDRRQINNRQKTDRKSK